MIVIIFLRWRSLENPLKLTKKMFGNSAIFVGDLYTIVWSSLSDTQRKDRKEVAYIKKLYPTSFNLGKEAWWKTNKDILAFDGGFIDADDSRDWKSEWFTGFWFYPGVYLACLIGKKYYYRTDFIFVIEGDGFVKIIDKSLVKSDDNKSYSRKDNVRFLAPFVFQEMNQIENSPHGK